jgi:F0F1-type ATP synthase beta subunit
MTRRLSLRREHLTELSAAALEAVGGGFGSVPCLTGYYPTLDYDCTKLVDRLTSAVAVSVDIC